MSARKPVPRVEDVEGALVVGRFYSVRAVYYIWYGMERWWPILGIRHTDNRFFNFEVEHYHLDMRFLGRDDAHDAYSAPLSARAGWPLPRPERRSFRCRRATLDYPYADKHPIMEINDAYAGVQARRARTGWICPHQRALLNAIPADADGVLTCPLHGLRIDAATGRCVGPISPPAALTTPERQLVGAATSESGGSAPLPREARDKPSARDT